MVRKPVPPQPAPPLPWLIHQSWMRDRAVVLCVAFGHGFFSTAYARRYRLGPRQHSVSPWRFRTCSGALGTAVFGAIADKVRHLEGSGVVVAGLYSSGLVTCRWPDPRLVSTSARGVLVGLRHWRPLHLASCWQRLPQTFAPERPLDWPLASVQAAGLGGDVRLRLNSSSGPDRCLWLGRNAGLDGGILMFISRSCNPHAREIPTPVRQQGHRIQTVKSAKPCSEALAIKSYLGCWCSGFFAAGFPGCLHHCDISRLSARQSALTARLPHAVAALIGFFNISSARWPRAYRPALFQSRCHWSGSIIGPLDPSTAFLAVAADRTSLVYSLSSWGLYAFQPCRRQCAGAIMFGTRHLGMLGGVWLFLSHRLVLSLASAWRLSLRYSSHHNPRLVRLV